MAALPTGTVTFLFTDIEGSTTRWEQQRQAMQRTLARHDAILRTAIEAHGGHVFKTVGDAFYAVFTTTPDAVNAALQAQALLHGESWDVALGALRVRMALHTGTAEERDGDYFGQPLNRVARLLGAGHGGQILLSTVTQELVRDQLPNGAELRDLGEHRLKDLIRTERIFQLVAPNLPRDFPPLKTLDNRPNNLPLQPNPLIGREREVEAVRQLLLQPEVRLVTLTGPGGTGKTRLALQVAADVLDDFADGAWFINLAPLTDPALVVPTIAQALGVQEVGGQPIAATLGHYLHDKRLLLVLDNFEQVLPAAEHLPALLDGAPGVKVLATSRMALRLYNEHEHLVPPLQVPDPRRLPSLERLQQYEAVRLFIQRAQAVKPDFQVTSGNAPAVAEICARLDGLPLAIELAAARTKMLPPEALLPRLNNRLKVLTGGARDLPARQQTLRAAIDWSFSLLDPGEQVLFARLAVFVGGSTLEAVEGVCNVEGDLEIDPFDGVASLLDKSLLRQEEGPGGEPRFLMLETIHEYAWERLELSGEIEDLRQRHAAYFLQVAEAAEVEFYGAQQGAWMTRLAAEQDNLRAALRWALERREAETALRLVHTLRDYWLASGQVTEGRQWIEAALATPQQAEAAVPVAGAASGLRAKALGQAAWAAKHQGDFGAGRLRAEEALALHRARADKREVALSLGMLAVMAADQGDYATAHERNGDALAIARELDNASDLALMLNIEGWHAYLAGDDARALTLLEESLALFRHVGDTSPWLCHTLDSLGKVLVARGDHARARALLTEGLHLAHQHGNRASLLSGLLEGLACLTAPEGTAQGEPVEGARRAARLFGAAAALRETSGEVLAPAERSMQERHVAFARAHLDAVAWRAAWAEGRAMTLEQAVAYALEETATIP